MSFNEIHENFSLSDDYEIKNLNNWMKIKTLVSYGIFSLLVLIENESNNKIPENYEKYNILYQKLLKSTLLERQLEIEELKTAESIEAMKKTKRQLNLLNDIKKHQEEEERLKKEEDEVKAKIEKDIAALEKEKEANIDDEYVSDEEDS